MKEIFEGAINGVKYTDPEAFKKAMDELVNSNKSFSSICSKKVVKEDDNQLDLFNDSVVSADNIFPSIDQALEKLADSEDIFNYDLLKEVKKDLNERKEYLEKNIGTLCSDDLMKRLNISRDRLNNRKRLLKSDIDTKHDELDKLEKDINELDNYRDKVLEKYENVMDYIEKLDYGKDMIESFDDYYEDCLNMLYDYISRDYISRGCSCKPEDYTPIPGEVKKADTKCDTKTSAKSNSINNYDINDVIKYLEFFKDLWK